MRSPGVHLREVTDGNRDAVRALRVRRDQRQFVASVSLSLKEAAKSRRPVPGTAPSTRARSRWAS
ncbi:hypothetical protein ACFQ1B_34600 [Streptomyces mexicanus]